MLGVMGSVILLGLLVFGGLGLLAAIFHCLAKITSKRNEGKPDEKEK
jgi:hypothetical protein